MGYLSFFVYYELRQKIVTSLKKNKKGIFGSFMNIPLREKKYCIKKDKIWIIR